ncbi:MAG: aminotransferase class I/II-fold pyridoxal phosphate-dependent enzyme [Anaerolineales bacterium]
MRPAQRVASIPPYFFASLAKRLTVISAQGVDVIRMDMGAPDLPPAPHIIRALADAAARPNAHSYTPFGGTPGFREAVAGFYRARFEVDLDPKTEILGLIGSKEGIFHLIQSYLEPGDITLVPDPSYPVYGSATTISGGEVVWMPLTRERGFLPDFDGIPADRLARAKVLCLNYPNNPTGAAADLAFFRRAVEFAKAHDLLLLHDAAYTEVAFDGFRPPSLLEVEGAKDVAVEFHTLSKTYNMAGWRLGMAVGNAAAIDALYVLKSQIDTSHFLPIQEAGVAALTGDQAWTQERNGVYRERRDAVLEGVRQIGMPADTPRAAMYVWAGLPAGESSSTQFCDRLLDATGVSVTPGTAFGVGGEGYVRFSLATPVERIREAMGRMVKWRGP